MQKLTNSKFDLAKLNDMQITTSTSADIHDEWKRELTVGKNKADASPTSHNYTFEMEYVGGLTPESIPIINDVTPKAIIKQNTHMILRSPAHRSPPSMFYYTLLDAAGKIPTQITDSNTNIGILGNESLSIQLWLEGLSNTNVKISKVSGVVGSAAGDTNYNLIIAAHSCNNASGTISNNILNTQMMVFTLQSLTALKQDGNLLLRLGNSPQLGKIVATILSGVFASTYLIQTFDGSLFLACVGYTRDGYTRDENSADDAKLPTILQQIQQQLSQNTCSYITAVKGVNIHSDIDEIFDQVKIPYTNITPPETPKDVIGDLADKIDNTIRFLQSHNVKISIYYQPDQIPNELKWFIDRK